MWQQERQIERKILDEYWKLMSVEKLKLFIYSIFLWLTGSYECEVLSNSGQGLTKGQLILIGLI